MQSVFYDPLASVAYAIISKLCSVIRYSEPSYSSILNLVPSGNHSIVKSSTPPKYMCSTSSLLSNSFNTANIVSVLCCPLSTSSTAVTKFEIFSFVILLSISNGK